MRRIIPVLFLLFFVFTSYGQNRLSTSRQSSALTYVYKLSSDETWSLARSNMKKASEKFLHTVVDSFRTGNTAPALGNGNYLFVEARGSRLQYELKTVGNLQHKLVNNDRDFVLFLHTVQGDIVSEAKVYLDNRQVYFKQSSGAFEKKGKNKKSWVRIYHKDVLYVFPVKSKKYDYYKPGLWAKISRSFPLKYIVSPVRKLLHPGRYGGYEFTRYTKNEKKFRGFMVFNKPVYKPGDTVKLKVFVTDRKGNPVNKELLLRISDRQLDVDSIIGTVRPYRKGAYEYSFVLNDSVDIKLDKKYTITLEEKRSRKYDLEDYDGRLEDDEYAAKRKVLIRGVFEYEDYELDAISVFARTDKQKHGRGEEVNVYLKATDENGLAVMDGRVKIIVRTDEYGNKEFGNGQIFLPDTLWTHDMVLDPVGETKLTVPDSIFPNVNFGYRVECIFLSANNEFHTTTINQSFVYSDSRIVFEQREDSLKIEFIRLGKTAPAHALEIAFNEIGDTISKSEILLPYITRINPFVSRYEVVAAGLSEKFHVARNNSSISCLSLRTKDSITVVLHNPQQLPAWISIFANKKLVYRGFGDSVSYKARTTTAKNYFVSLQYLEAGEIRRQDYTVPYRDKLLNIESDQPQFIYPGQRITINIQVKDNEGKAVPDADVTAYAFTSKFDEAETPNVPYLGKNYKYRKKGANYRPGDFDTSASVKLNWQRWSREMGLDTIEYYKFLHPKQIYTSTEAAKDSITQIAPFIVSGGDIQPVHLIYIDEKPVFFAQSEHLQRYSFRVSPGKHSFRFRTIDRLIRLDSFVVTKGVKTFLSVDIDSVKKDVQVYKMSERLTDEENILWRKYMILVRNDFRENYTTIQQGNEVYLLKPKDYYYGSLLVGPLTNNEARLEVKNGFNLNFDVEAGYEYTFREDLVKQKQVNADNLFRSYLWNTNDDYNFTDFVLTEKEIDDLWQNYLDYRSATADLFTNDYYSNRGNGRLWVQVTNAEENKKQFIKNVLLFRKDDPDFLRVYKGTTENFGNIRPGKYSLFYLLKGDNYFILDSIQVKSNGINFYETGIIRTKQKDSVSIKIWDIISKREKYGQSNASDFDLIKESYNQIYLDSSVLTNAIQGIIRDSNGRPIPGAVVTIKGTKFGTTTDNYGHFTLKAPSNVTIVISSVGFLSKQVRLNDGTSNDFVLAMDRTEMQEVVVTALGKSHPKRPGTSSVSAGGEMLFGKVAGVNSLNSTGGPGSSGHIVIRGTGSLQGETAPLYVVDGIPVEADVFRSLNSSEFQSVDILKDEAATALYGQRGSSGVILVTTKRGLLQKTDVGVNQQPVTGNSLRNNFKDAAYWQPRLRTDAKGMTSFEVTFPDDITNWRTFVIASNGKRQTGFSEGFIKSFKALSANLGLPQFTVEGDSVNIIGKALNYSTDSVLVKQSFSVNDQLNRQKSFVLRNVRIDTFGIVAATGDSLKLKYTIERGDGYFDGEERSIPVFRQGAMETSGFFAALNNDTSVRVELKSTNPVKIYADASIFSVLEAESEKIRNYEYQCNEQLASKLKAWLVQKTIDSVLKRPFKGSRNIKELISKLNQNKSDGGLWGWWKNTDPEIWISLHVVEALVKAQKAGYETGINRSIIIDYLIYNLESNKGREKITSLNLLQLLDAKADFRKYTDTLDKNSRQLSMYDKLRLAEIKQKLDINISLDSLKSKRQQTMLGSIYWGDEGNHFFDNSIQNTLLVYRLLRSAGESKELLQKIRNYFLEKKKVGNWRNTYESSLILETILPDILVNDSLPASPSLTISGQTTFTINKFPYQAIMPPGENFTVSKQGTLPVYFTAYEEHWNSRPSKVEKGFIVSSVFERDGETQNRLVGGEPVDLKIKISVLKDADYILIEIPVPAGCSYKNKNRVYTNNEVHREYFKNKVSIFCSTLKRGDYTFTVSLLPRYTGIYNLNPAKAELMYFPVFFGREELKKISIQ